jgi:hypothetical protein
MVRRNDKYNPAAEGEAAAAKDFVEQSKTDLLGATARYYEREFEACVDNTVAALERAVAEIKANKYRDHYGTNRGGVQRAAAIINHATWIVGNCGLGALVGSGTTVDRAWAAVDAAKETTKEAE